MSTKIKIFIKDIIMDAELFDTPCARAIAAALPIEARPNEWGDEFYFQVPVKMSLDETATTKVKIDDSGYCAPANSLALFFGPTPMSSVPYPVPASEVNLVGRVIGEAAVLKKGKGAGSIRIMKD